MSAEELVKAGKLEEALQELQQRVRSQPADATLRTFLFQLLCVLGQWKRALTQLDVVHDLDVETWPMVHAYKEAINCEMHRQAVFQGKSKPLVLGEPNKWMALLIGAQQALAQGDTKQFLSMNEQALEQAPASSGKINGEDFEWLADADLRFGPVLEVIFNSQYYWVPLNTIKSLRSEDPSDLRDLVWLPAEITWTNGGQNMVMMPARYPALSGLDHDSLLARKTEWQPVDENLAEGLGQRMLATDQADYPLLKIRTIELNT